MRKYFPQGVLWCKKPEREHGARQPLPLTAAVFFACAAMPRNRAKRDAKNSRSAERGCSSVLPPPNRRRMVGARNPAPPLAGYAAQSRKARCKNSSPPQNAARRPIRRWNIPLCPSFVYISHKIHAQSLSYCYVGGRLIAANSIYLINIVRLPHVGRAATKIPSRLQIKNKPNVK